MSALSLKRIFRTSLSKRDSARFKVLGAMGAATLFIVPFKVAASEGRGAGAALGLLVFVVVLFGPWALRRALVVNEDVRKRSFSLAWKIAVVAAFGNIAQGYAFETLHAGVAAAFIQLNILLWQSLACCGCASV